VRGDTTAAKTACSGRSNASALLLPILQKRWYEKEMPLLSN
jgi:hypothetical protein